MNIEEIIDSGEFILFFTFEKNLFGASESARVTYAKMKDKDDEDNTPGWRKEASFTATNLNKLVKGEDCRNIFYFKDLSKMKVVSDKKKIKKLLSDEN